MAVATLVAELASTLKATLDHVDVLELTIQRQSERIKALESLVIGTGHAVTPPPPSLPERLFVILVKRNN